MGNEKENQKRQNTIRFIEATQELIEADGLKSLSIRKIADKGITVLLVEHDMKLVMNVTHQICVISFGKRIAFGTPEEIQQNPDVIEAYLGGGLDV